AVTPVPSYEPPAVTPVPAYRPPAEPAVPVYEAPAEPSVPAYDPVPSTVSFSDDTNDEYLAFRDHASADTDDGNPYTDDEEPEMPSAEELAAPVAPPQDPGRTVVTSTGKVIKGEFERTRERMEKARAETEAGEVKAAAEASSAAAEAMPEYRYPPVDLLEKGRTNPLAGSQEEYRQTAMKLQQTLHSFGVDVTVTNISCGPVVTRYELLPAQGVKVSRIVGLSDDIKLSLAAADIRIEAPVPGKSVVGIEVPNKENNTVYLRDLFESPQFTESRAKLAFAVGKDIGGQTVVTDIAKMPHLLIAGATGSGKSVCINTLIMSILFRYDPKDVKLIMVDPKVVELSVYNGIPHLLIPVVTDPKKAAGALNWAVAEMTDRYTKFEKTGARNLKGYNEKIMKAREDGTVPEEDLPALLPQIVIIIDELADLMMVAKGEVEESICRLAQLARAAGLHLVIATQRPSVNVITGLIKANIPSRIAFAVSSGVDSRTILDSYGAEKLLGKGDMLFSPQGAPRPMRVQGAFVSDGDVQKVVDYIKDEGLPLAYSKETVEKMIRGADAAPAETGSSRDELFANAGRFIIDKKKASIGNLQRMFKIGFNRAARIMDQLSEAGVVGEEQGTKPREILMTAEQFEELLRQTQ
ncbi:MAG: DNA translocase FtsK, partial [Stomatobaculum sp.]|nr:DNA translocase FtsK [Stomatobaculum sp.]